MLHTCNLVKKNYNPKTIRMTKRYDVKMELVFSQLQQKGALTTPGNYWQQGCVLDTVIDYLQYAVANNLMSAAEAQKFMAFVYAKCYQGIYNGKPYAETGCWYDDFGWWGIASSKAFDTSYGEVFGKYTAQYQAISLHCWNVMKNGKGDGLFKGAPNVWSNCDQQAFAFAEPRFHEGVWQGEIFPNDRPTSCNNWGDPAIDPLGPFQLSVVNTLYLLLAGRLAEAGQVPWSDVAQQYKFFQDWMGPLTPMSIVTNLPNGGALIRERVGRYKNGQTVYAFNEQSFWGGDQGLFLSGITIYLQHAKAVSPLIGNIAWGVCKNMVDNNYVIQPWLVGPGYSVYSLDPDDYSSGCGVFMRNLLFSSGRNQDVKAKVDTPDYQTLMRRSADIYASGEPPKTVNPLFDLFNQLSVMLTAANLLHG
jgi:hypothetical protein